MANPGERIDLPSGEAVYFDDSPGADGRPQHAYYRCKPDGSRGKRLTGVTTVTKAMDLDPSRLLTWAAKVQCIGIAELVGPIILGEIDVGELEWLTSQEAIWQALEDADLTFEQVRDRAAKRGTNVHQLALQALAAGRPVPDFEGMTPEEQGYARAVVAFWLEHDPTPLQVEQIVYSERLGVAGRFDLRCTMEGYEGPGVLDLKTGGFISASAHTQVGGGYPLLCRESGIGECEWALILKVSEDGSFELIEAEGTPESFELAVATYREAGRINREAGKARKARQEQLKVAA